MFLALTIVAQFQQPVLNGIELTPSQVISRPLDIQPTVNAQFLQQTFDPQQAAGVQCLQNAATTELYQRTYNPQ